jgi:hypothetical protein
MKTEQAKNYADTKAIRQIEKAERAMEALKVARSTMYQAWQSTGRDSYSHAYHDLTHTLKTLEKQITLGLGEPKQRSGQDRPLRKSRRRVSP